MNTPVDDNKQISMFDYMQNKNNSSASSSTTTTAAPEVTVFKNLVHPEFGELRTVEIDGEPWFVGKDVAVALGYKKPENAIANHVSDEDKTSTLIQGVVQTIRAKPPLLMNPAFTLSSSAASFHQQKSSSTGLLQKCFLYPQEWCLHPKSGKYDSGRDRGSWSYRSSEDY